MNNDLDTVSRSVSPELLETNKLKRLQAHTDFDTFTVSCPPCFVHIRKANPGQFLFQDEIGGLEVEDPNEPGKYLVRIIVRAHLHINVIT
jgi:hypothetical protein